jgi:hypothetical protein
MYFFLLVIKTHKNIQKILRARRETSYEIHDHDMCCDWTATASVDMVQRYFDYVKVRKKSNIFGRVTSKTNKSVT